MTTERNGYRKFLARARRVILDYPPVRSIKLARATGSRDRHANMSIIVLLTDDLGEIQRMNNASMAFVVNTGTRGIVLSQCLRNEYANLQ